MNLEEQLDQNRQAWMPEAGDKLIGRVVEVDMLESRFGGSYPFVVLETDDGEQVAVHGFHAVLKGELARKRPKVGDRLGIKFLGQGAKVDYLGYTVRIERAEPETSTVDWDAVAAEANEEFDGVPPASVDAPPLSDADAPAW